MNLTRFEECVFQRLQVVSFKPDVPQEELLQRLVSVAQKTPSLMDLQPTRYVIIRDPKVKEAVSRASWVTARISEAPLYVAFVGDRNVSFAKAGESTSEDAFDLLFSHKPLGLGWVFKALCVPFLRFFSPTPELPAVHKRAWLYKELSMTAAHFMLAAEAAGLATHSIDYFDERRVKRALRLPRSFVVPIILAVGYPEKRGEPKPLLPVSEVVVHS